MQKNCCLLPVTDDEAADDAQWDTDMADAERADSDIADPGEPDSANAGQLDFDTEFGSSAQQDSHSQKQQPQQPAWVPPRAPEVTEDLKVLGQAWPHWLHC